MFLGVNNSARKLECNLSKIYEETPRLSFFSVYCTGHVVSANLGIKCKYCINLQQTKAVILVESVFGMKQLFSIPGVIFILKFIFPNHPTIKIKLALT